MIERVETLRDLVELAVSTKSRWYLDSTWHSEWVDEEAGEQWETELLDVYQTDDDEAIQAVRDRRPEKRRVQLYFLRKDDDRAHRSTTIGVDPELGEQLDSIWTKGPIMEGLSTLERKGAIQIQTMLRRLGHSDIVRDIDNKREAERAEEEKRARARHAKRIAKEAENLLWLIKNGPSLGLPTAELEMMARMGGDE